MTSLLASRGVSGEMSEDVLVVMYSLRAVSISRRRDGFNKIVIDIPRSVGGSGDQGRE